MEGGILPILAAIATAAGGLGVAYAVFTSAKVQSTILLYKEENAAQGKRITSLEAESKVAVEAMAALRRENDVLRDLATGRSTMEALASDMRDAENLRREEHRQMIGVMTEIHQQLVLARQRDQREEDRATTRRESRD